MLDDKLRYFWFFDIETTGLDPEQHSVIEAASVIVDSNFMVRAELTDFIDESDGNRDDLRWNPYALDMHRESGLLDEWMEARNADDPLATRRLSTFVGDTQEALDEIAEKDLRQRGDFPDDKRKVKSDGYTVKDHQITLDEIATVVLSGNSVHFDREWVKWLDEIGGHGPHRGLQRALSHRHLDARTTSALCQTIDNEDATIEPEGDVEHRALADAKRSFERLYRARAMMKVGARQSFPPKSE